MTETEQDQEIGRTIREYSDNERLIACLTSKLERIADAIPAFLKNVDHEKARGTLVTHRGKHGDNRNGLRKSRSQTSFASRQFEERGSWHPI